MTNGKKQIGFVSTRFAGTDGVSLETRKWVQILQQHGYQCFFFAGECDYPADVRYVLPEAHFAHPEITELNNILFDTEKRSRDISDRVSKIKNHLKDHLYLFVEKFGIDLLIVENALSIPMNIPLGLALTQFIAETNIPTIAHHHDFAWERVRFAVTAADDYLRTAFPPTLRSVQHVVINSFAAQQLALRAGVGSTLIPNVMDFENPPTVMNGYTRNLRADLGVADDDWLLLQPTRIVPRKQIEHAIDLAAMLGDRAVLVISHAGGDEGPSYEQFLRNYMRALGARVIFAADRIAHDRATMAGDRKIYSLADMYHAADLVTYPSRVEGFGNAFLETLYYRRPIVLNTYEIFKTDIQPKGFKVVGFNEYITDDTVQQARTWLENPALVAELVDYNYQLGLRYYSFSALEERLLSAIHQTMTNHRHG